MDEDTGVVVLVMVEVDCGLVEDTGLVVLVVVEVDCGLVEDTGLVVLVVVEVDCGLIEDTGVVVLVVVVVDCGVVEDTGVAVLVSVMVDDVEEEIGSDVLERSSEVCVLLDVSSEADDVLPPVELSVGLDSAAPEVSDCCADEVPCPFDDSRADDVLSS